MRRTRKAINNLSLCKNIIRKAPIQSGIKHLCTSRAQNDTLEAALSHSVQAHSAYAHPVRRMICLKQYWVTACRPTVLMRILCAEWYTWSSTESQRAGPQCLCASCSQNDTLEATLSHSAQAQRSGVRIEKFKAQRKAILMRSVLNVPQFFEPFLLTVLNISYCACKEPFIVLSTTVLWSNRHLIESNTI